MRSGRLNMVRTLQQLSDHIITAGSHLCMHCKLHAPLNTTNRCGSSQSLGEIRALWPIEHIAPVDSMVLIHISILCKCNLQGTSTISLGLDNLQLSLPKAHCRNTCLRLFTTRLH